MPSKKDLEERIKSLEVAVDFSGGILERLDEIEHWVGVVDRLNFYMHGQPGLRPGILERLDNLETRAKEDEEVTMNATLDSVCPKPDFSFIPKSEGEAQQSSDGDAGSSNAPGSSGESDRSGALDSDPLDPPVGLATSPSDAFCQVIAERNQARAEWDRLRSGIEAAANSLKRGLPIYEADLRALLDGGDDE